MPSENDPRFMEVLKRVANGDEEALKTCCLGVTYFHIFDDIVDGDIKLSARELVKMNNVFLRLTTSKFFLTQLNILGPVIMLVGDAYALSNESNKYNNFRHAGNEFLRAVALITGGEANLEERTKELVDFSLKDHYTEDGKGI